MLGSCSPLASSRLPSRLASYIGYYVHEAVVPKIYASGRNAMEGRNRRMGNLPCPALAWPALNEDKHSSLAAFVCYVTERS